MSGYGQFCPVAKAMELLDERWTMLVVRELLAGSTPLQRSAPRSAEDVSGAVVQAAEVATRAGVVERAENDGRTTYALTDCGKELAEVVDALGAWGVRWIGELGEEDLDPHLLMWDIRRTIPVAEWPRTRTTWRSISTGWPSKASRWWLVVADGEADVCDFDPGYEVTAPSKPICACSPASGAVMSAGLTRCSTAASRCRDQPMYAGRSRRGLASRCCRPCHGRRESRWQS